MEEFDFKDILEDFLIQQKMTQTAFAHVVGVKQSQVSEWLKGKAKPGYDILKRMSLALGVSADFWLGVTSNDR